MGNRRNQNTYAASGIVDYYARLSRLQPAEVSLLERLRSQLATMKLLDIGVGGGRTTIHFAPLVAQYVGIDYSPKMIAACQQRFRSFEYSTHFEVCDARDLSRFDDCVFDFVLFSYNGIDYVSHEDRLQIFAEIKRVCRPNGYFFFSSHNLDALESKCSWKNQLSLNPLEAYINLFKSAFFRAFNISLSQKKIQNANHIIVRDDSHMFRLETYYIRAAHQLQQLEKDFDRIEFLSWQNHKSEPLDLESPVMKIDMWLYYLCRVKTA